MRQVIGRFFAASHAFTLLAVVCGVTGPAAGADYFVSTGGADTNEGTTARSAFRTIQRAADVAGPGDRVVIGSGTYRESVRPANSGTAGRPVTFEPAAGATVVVSGADPVDGWEPAGGNGLYRAPMPANFLTSAMGQSDQVFLAGRMMTLARWPNTGPDVSRPAKATSSKFVSKTRDEATKWTTGVFEDDELDPAVAKIAGGASVYFQPNDEGWGWTLSGEVVDVRGKRVTFRSRSDDGKDGAPGYADKARYYLYGTRALLDAPGEWFHDADTGTLYLKAPDGKRPANGAVEAKRRDFGFDLSGRSYVTIRGLNLFACSITTDAQSCGDGRWHDADGAARYPWRGNDFVAPSTNVTLDGLNAKYLNHYTDVSGHFFLSWPMNTGLVLSGADHVVQNCRIQYAAGSGITLQGLRHKALNNVVLDTNYQSTGCYAIGTGTNVRTRDVEIANNTINRTARDGIGLRELANSDPANLVARVHHNDVMNYGLQDWDLGAFYTFGSDGQFTRIDHNLFHCDEPRQGWVNGIYFDFSKNYLVDHNVVWGVPVPLQLTKEHDPDGAKLNNMLIYNNTLITNGAPWSKAFGSDTNKGSVVQNNIIRAAVFANPNGGTMMRLPFYGSSGAEVVSNVIVGTPREVGYKEGAVGPTDVTLATTDTARTFVDPDAHDFRLRAGSPAAGKGTALSSQERDRIAVAPVPDAPPGGSVDAGAYERGADWTAGSTLATPADKGPVDPGWKGKQ